MYSTKRLDHDHRPRSVADLGGGHKVPMTPPLFNLEFCDPPTQNPIDSIQALDHIPVPVAQLFRASAIAT